MATDASGEVVWYVGEYGKNIDLVDPTGGWGTFIAAGWTEVGFGNCPAGCADGIDNDDDGALDGADAGCRNAADPSERHGCSDLLDNDGDSLVDFPLDPGCSSSTDHTEASGGCGLGYELGAGGVLAVALRRRTSRARSIPRQR